MKNLQSNIHVNRLRNAYRQGTTENIQFFILQAMKRASTVESSPREKTEIALESARVYRMIGEETKAQTLCDSALANIPAGCADLIGELNRLRVQLYLDAGKFKSAEDLIETTDGLEMTLHGNTSVISRKDENVRVETWLLAVETAIAQGKTREAKEFFDKAIDKLTKEENDFHKKKLTVFEKRYLQTYFDDMRDAITLFGAVLQIQIGGESGAENLSLVRDLADRLREKVKGGANMAAVGNAPLLGKCLVILREWNAEEDQVPPAGINLAEAARWYKFISPIKYFPAPGAEENSLALPADYLRESEDLSADNLQKHTGAETGENDVFLNSNENARAMMDIADSLKSLKDLASTLSENHRTETLFQDKIAFAGHLMTIDIGAILRNVSDSHFTGFIKFNWKPSNYEGEIVLGKISPAVEAGSGYLFAVQGNIIDATLGDMKPSAAKEDADRNFDLLIQLGWSIGLSEETPPDIKFDSIAEPVVEKRPRLMEFNHDALINRVTSITNRIFGITEDEEEDEFDMDGFDSAFMMNGAASADSPVADAARHVEIEEVENFTDPFAVSESNQVLPVEQPEIPATQTPTSVSEQPTPTMVAKNETTVTDKTGEPRLDVPPGEDQPVPPPPVAKAGSEDETGDEENILDL